MRIEQDIRDDQRIYYELGIKQPALPSLENVKESDNETEEPATSR